MRIETYGIVNNENSLTQFQFDGRIKSGRMKRNSPPTPSPNFFHMGDVQEGGQKKKESSEGQ